MIRRSLLPSAIMAAALTLAVTAPTSRPALAAGLDTQSDPDAFMQKVLASRDGNWKRLRQYILDERERIEVRGPSRQPVSRSDALVIAPVLYRF